MKDRTPKYRGRVKLLPVSGQENIYDMTRADEPDDTGTPFNKRTMLQDSTAKFLQLNVANPFVDDALRQMPDRINPIGTIRTTPQESLGAAWLKCDGAQVTFSNYPELYQMLKNVDGAAEWNHIAVGTAPEFKAMSKPVKFKGKWYIAGSYSKKPNGTITRDFVLSIARADELLKEYVIVKTETKKGEASGATAGTEIYENLVQAASTDDVLAFVWYATKSEYDSTDVCYITTSTDGETWTTRQTKPRTPTGMNYAVPFITSFQTDGEYWAMNDTQKGIYTMTDIERDTEWQYTRINEAYMLGLLSKINGIWMIVSGGFSENSTLLTAKIFTAARPDGEWRKNDTTIPKGSSNISSLAYYAGRYWVVLNDTLVASSDLEKWEAISSGAFDVGTARTMWLIATKRQLALGTATKVYTSSLPETKWSEAKLPAGALPKNLTAAQDLLSVSWGALLAYHDYAEDERSLPNISLSDDTTTFIKAKREIDVFEATENGGDAS